MHPERRARSQPALPRIGLPALAATPLVVVLTLAHAPRAGAASVSSGYASLAAPSGPSAGASGAPNPAPVPAAASTPSRAADVRVHERTVFSLRAARAGQSAQERARAATAALEAALDDPVEPTTHVEEQSGTAVIFAGKTPVVALGEDDAVSAGGDVTLHVYAAGVGAKIDDALRAERRRSTISERVFSFSLLVFSGLLAFLLVRRVGDLSGRMRMWVRANPDRIPALQLGRIEVVRPAAVRGAVSIALALAHRLAQVAIAYLWLIFALSRFEATRAYTDRLAGFVLVPLSALIERLGASLPLVVVAAIAAVAVGIAVRFVGLFFAGVERGETHLSWLPQDLAGPTSVLVRAGMVILSIVLAAPLITGTDDGALSRAGVVALAALGIACTPVLACAAAGLPAVFGRRVRPGEFIEAGGRAGVVRDVTLLELVLEDAFGCEVRVPQLLGLWHPIRILGAAALATIDVVVDPRERPAKVEEALVGAAVATCERARVELISLDADGARWRVAGVPKHGKGPAALADAVARAVADHHIGLGKASASPGVPIR
ncbi:MAG TPA: mechanosensitive ion channel family protein [Polyangiaceae bacterium]|nr:mechanosensitive ion channel family protein [Polyangiaceae bacterium]